MQPTLGPLVHTWHGRKGNYLQEALLPLFRPVSRRVHSGMSVMRKKPVPSSVVRSFILGFSWPASCRRRRRRRRQFCVLIAHRLRLRHRAERPPAPVPPSLLVNVFTTLASLGRSFVRSSVGSSHVSPNPLLHFFSAHFYCATDRPATDRPTCEITLKSLMNIVSGADGDGRRLCINTD